MTHDLQQTRITLLPAELSEILWFERALTVVTHTHTHTQSTNSVHTPITLMIIGLRLCMLYTSLCIMFNRWLLEEYTCTGHKCVLFMGRPRMTKCKDRQIRYMYGLFSKVMGGCLCEGSIFIITLDVLQSAVQLSF